MTRIRKRVYQTKRLPAPTLSEEVAMFNSGIPKWAIELGRKLRGGYYDYARTPDREEYSRLIDHFQNDEPNF